jgi:flavin-dependent dehydrogenase
MPDFDVIVVGARCAGASLAAFLASGGARVLVVDSGTLHSDQILSTHYIHPVGMDVLDALGVGDQVRDGCPPTRTLRLTQDEVSVDLPNPANRAGYCPRRDRLDGLLQDAAAAAGAELRDQARVVALGWDGDRVTGVRLRHGGQELEVTAGLVVGADGRRSTVAQLVGAEESFGYDAPRGAYWAYWDAPELWWSGPEHAGFDFYFSQRGDDLRLIFQTDSNQLLIGSVPPLDVARSWRGDHEQRLIESLRGDPITAPLVEGRRPNGKVRGTLQERFFFRQAAGPGWALVGDAGHHKDPAVGDGITDALRQAQALARAIAHGSDAALVRYWRQRDVDYYPLFRFAELQGSPEAVGALDRLVFAQASQSATLRERMMQPAERALSPFDVVGTTQALRWVLAALARGDWGVAPEFLALGRRMATWQRELRALHMAASEANRIV